MTKEEKPKQHKRIVDLDAGERSATSLYLAVRCYGKVYEPTRVERILLKLYNTPSVGTMQQLHERAEYVRTRFPGDYNQFVRTVYTYEAYGRVHRQIQQLGDTCRSMAKIAQAWDNLACDTEPPTRWKSDERALHDQQRQHIAQWLFDDGIEPFAAALFALQNWFDANDLQPYMAPFPFRAELKRLWASLDVLDNLMRRIDTNKEQTRPPFRWDYAKPGVNQHVVNFYMGILKQATRDLENILNI